MGYFTGEVVSGGVGISKFGHRSGIAGGRCILFAAEVLTFGQGLKPGFAGGRFILLATEELEFGQKLELWLAGGRFKLLLREEHDEPEISTSILTDGKIEDPSDEG